MKYITALLLAITLQASAEENYIAEPKKLHHLEYWYTPTVKITLYGGLCGSYPAEGYVAKVEEVELDDEIYGCWGELDQHTYLVQFHNGKDPLDYQLFKERFEAVYE